MSGIVRRQPMANGQHATGENLPDATDGYVPPQSAASGIIQHG